MFRIKYTRNKRIHLYRSTIIERGNAQGIRICAISSKAQWFIPWWRHQMETFSALLAICAGNSPVPSEFPTQRPVTRSFDVVFDLRLNKRLSKQWWGWWFETLSRPLWRHRNVHCNENVVIPTWLPPPHTLGIVKKTSSSQTSKKTPPKWKKKTFVSVTCVDFEYRKKKKRRNCDAPAAND